MAVTNQLTTIHSLDQATDAVTSCTVSGADNNFTSDAGEYVEGSAGFSFDLDAETHTVVFTPSSSLDLTSKNIWIWMMFFTPSFLGTWSSGAVKCRLSDGTNYSEWYLGGSDNPLMSSAWARIVFYTGSTPDAVSGTLSISAVTTITYYFTGVSKSKLAQNVFIDYLQYGNATDGIKITGGGSGTEETFADVVGDDETAAAGMIQEVDGVYFLSGSITFGDTATNNCYFKDENQLIVSKSFYRSFTTTNRTSAESLVGSSHFTVKVQNYSTGTCNFELGSAAGGRGTSGCVFKTGGNQKISFDFNDTDIDVLKLYACTFIDCATTALPTAISGSEVYDCTWNGCGEVNVSTFKFRYCNFVNATSNAIQVDSTSFDVTDCNFISPTTAGVELTVAGPYTFNNLQFVGTSGSGPYDVNNTYGSSITVNNTGTLSNAQYYTGSTVTFQGSVTVTITVKDNDTKAAIVGAQVSMWYESVVGGGYDTQVMNEDTITSGVASETYTGTTPKECVLRVRKSEDTDDPRYYAFSDIVTIASGTGYSRTVYLKQNDKLN